MHHDNVALVPYAVDSMPKHCKGNFTLRTPLNAIEDAFDFIWLLISVSPMTATVVIPMLSFS
jgi:hypothetical protein